MKNTVLIKRGMKIDACIANTGEPIDVYEIVEYAIPKSAKKNSKKPATKHNKFVRNAIVASTIASIAIGVFASASCNNKNKRLQDLGSDGKIHSATSIPDTIPYLDEGLSEEDIFQGELSASIESLPVDDREYEKGLENKQSLFHMTYTMAEGDRYYESADYEQAGSDYRTVSENNTVNKPGTYIINSVAIKDEDGLVQSIGGDMVATMPNQFEYLTNATGDEYTISVHLGRYDLGVSNREDGYVDAGWVDLSMADKKLFILGLQANQSFVQNSIVVPDDESKKAMFEQINGAVEQFNQYKEHHLDEYGGGFNITRDYSGDRIFVNNFKDRKEHGIGFGLNVSDPNTWNVIDEVIPDIVYNN
ncbi:MAG: hypothetical protein LBM09_03075 [Candidatus Nomurabacteria bacterium]|jgi:hypothetical protein|nr:hypothetical protein [Candidatus Nomurabacteria bacterium]